MTDTIITSTGRPAIRCSDADRERTCRRLSAAASDGYLSMEELDDRLAGAFAARHHHELDGLVTDLPPVSRPAATGWRTVWTAFWAQLAAEFVLLIGRGAVGWPRRRIIVALAGTLLVLAVAAAVVHGFIGGGEHHGVHDHGGEVFRHP